jgi:hypothetical protein
MELPTVRGIHLCEQVIIEEKSRNASLINCFTTRLWHGASHRHQFVLYSVLSGIRGTIQLTIRVTELSNDADVISKIVPFTFVDPIFDHRLVHRFTDRTFPRPGAYEILILVDEESIAVTRLTLLKELSQ